ncbi:hypothetical protein [Actinomadura gamaensis]|uniref:Uncharacterized protein n=1 Tax=Actinomadura gamaensis TaxID=1763541 RepID=A0ABV9TNX1_9ACTN
MTAGGEAGPGVHEVVVTMSTGRRAAEAFHDAVALALCPNPDHPPPCPIPWSSSLLEDAPVAGGFEERLGVLCGPDDLAGVEELVRRTLATVGVAEYSLHMRHSEDEPELREDYAELVEQAAAEGSPPRRRLR